MTDLTAGAPIYRQGKVKQLPVTAVRATPLIGQNATRYEVFRTTSEGGGVYFGVRAKKVTEFTVSGKESDDVAARLEKRYATASYPAYSEVVTGKPAENSPAGLIGKVRDMVTGEPLYAVHPTYHRISEVVDAAKAAVDNPGKPKVSAEAEKDLDEGIHKLLPTVADRHVKTLTKHLTLIKGTCREVEKDRKTVLDTLSTLSAFHNPRSDEGY